jgi:hypothetical protein
VSEDGEGFLARWSRRKALVREGKPAPPEPAVAATSPPLAKAVPPPTPVAPTGAVPPPAGPAAPERPPAPTLDDVARLTRGSDYTRFVAADVDPQVKNAALKKLFADPQFNVMDGLDVYIDDYGKPDPIPASMLRQMVQSRALGLFDDEEDEERRRQAVAAGEGADPDGSAVAGTATCAPDDIGPPTLDAANDPDPAVRLQPDDAAGPAGPGPGPGEDAGRER